MSGQIRYTPQGGHGDSSRRGGNNAPRRESPDDHGPPGAPPPPQSPATYPTDPAFAPTPGPLPEPLPRQRNVHAVLALGATRYATIRGLGTFCCPPVPFTLGQRGMDLYVNMMNAARGVVMTGEEQAQKDYYRYMRRMAKLLHAHIRPVGLVKRMLWRVGLMRNPFLQCSEQEIKDVADFFLHGRMKSSVQFTSELVDVSA